MNKIKIIFNRFRPYIANTSWIMSEKILHMGVAFLVAILVARYLGPEQFGVLAYSISITGLFAVAGHMGLVGLLVREIVKIPTEHAETLGTGFVLKMLGMVSGFIALCVFAFLSEEYGSTEFWVLIIIATSILCKPFDVIDFWFQAHIQSKYTSIARSIALILSECFKIILIIIGAELLFFAFANLIQTSIVALLLFVFYQKTVTLSIWTWFTTIKKAKKLISQSWIIFLSTIFSVIYLKIDLIMLKWMVTPKEVGIYAVASSISEAWYFLPAAIVASLFPQLISLRETNVDLFYHRLQQVFDLLFLLALCVAILITFLGEPLITKLFGESYQRSGMILRVHIWAAIFIFMRAVVSKWILIENVFIFSLVTQALGAITNVLLNLLLIPQYQGNGAAIATLLSYAMASYVALIFHKKTRPIFIMMTRSLVSPIRYTYCFIQSKLSGAP